MCPPTLVKDEVNNEKELHAIIQKECEALEEGVKILRHEFQCGDRGTADFLYADSGNRLGVIEVKKDTDEDILFQGLRYYDWINKNRYAVANMFPKAKIDPNQNPRLTLIAGSFSDDIRSLSTLVIPDVELFEYSVLKDKNNERGICFHPVSPPKIYQLPDKQNTIDDLIHYITDENMQKLFKNKIKEIEELNNKIEKYSTEGYVGFSYKGRQLAFLTPYRKGFGFYANKLDDKLKVVDYPLVRITVGNEDYSPQLEIISESLKKLDNR